VLLLRWYECSCDVNSCSLHDPHANFMLYQYANPFSLYRVVSIAVTDAPLPESYVKYVSNRLKSDGNEAPYRDFTSHRLPLYAKVTVWSRHVDAGEFHHVFFFLFCVRSLASVNLHLPFICSLFHSFLTLFLDGGCASARPLCCLRLRTWFC
jgi:hypothetical protein